jgi:hypothetical protein
MRARAASPLPAIVAYCTLLAACESSEKKAYASGMEELKPLMATLHDRAAALNVTVPEQTSDPTEDQLQLLDFEQKLQPLLENLDGAAADMQGKAKQLEVKQPPGSEGQRSMKSLGQSLAAIRSECRSVEKLVRCKKEVADFEEYFSANVYVANH